MVADKDYLIEKIEKAKNKCDAALRTLESMPSYIKRKSSLDNIDGYLSEIAIFLKSAQSEVDNARR